MKIDYDNRPLEKGEHRSIVIHGNGPFLIYSGCFVDTPPPVGFRECAACSPKQISSGGEFVVDSSTDFWKGKAGRVKVIITDSNNKVETIELVILSDIDRNYDQGFNTVEM